MTSVIDQWVARVIGELRPMAAKRDRGLQARRNDLSETRAQLSDSLISERLTILEARCLGLEEERGQLAAEASSRRAAYIQAVERAFAACEAALPSYEAAMGRGILAAGADFLGQDIGLLSPAEISGLLEQRQPDADKLRRRIAKLFAEAAKTLTDGLSSAEGLAGQIAELAAVRNATRDIRHTLCHGWHSVSPEVVDGLFGLTSRELQDMADWLHQAIADAEMEAGLAPRLGLVAELDGGP